MRLRAPAGVASWRVMKISANLTEWKKPLKGRERRKKETPLLGTQIFGFQG